MLQDVETFLGGPPASVLEHEDTDAGHDRTGTRKARVSTGTAWLSARQGPALAAIGCVNRTRTGKRTGAATTERPPHQLARVCTPERLLALPRGRWAVERNLHWGFDAAMGGDTSLVPRGHGPRSRAALKRVALNAVRIVAGKNSLRHSLREAVLDGRVLARILNYMPVA